MPVQIVTYQVDDSMMARFEVESLPGFSPAAGPGAIAGRVRDAVGPAVEAAKAVLERVSAVRPDHVEVTFGVKVSGGADWLIAKSAAEASFEIKLTWTSRENETAAARPGGAGVTQDVAGE